MSRFVKTAASFFAFASITAFSLVGCSADNGADDESDDGEVEPSSEGTSNLTSSVDCHIKMDTAYVSGSAKPIKLITVGGKPTSIAVGHQFLKMQKAADAAGVSLSINSGFRTMAEQQHLYNCYKTKSCNNGNLAAKPGYSNHQGGFALDLTTSSWLASHAGSFGFVRTVPSEAWHYEYHGPDTGGPCDSGGSGSTTAPPDDNGGGADPDVTCRSATLGKNVAPGTCVHRADSGKWYVCDADAPGDWPTVSGPSDPQCKTCPQNAGGQCD
jgi:hypothetical protein